MKQRQQVTERVQWIDLAKGIAILLTIVGHSVEYGIKGSYVRGMIFSFHMPLFFILSMITYRNAQSLEEFKKKTQKAFYHLIIPALIVYVLYTCLQCVENIQLITDLSFWKEKLYTFIFASGVSLEYGGMEIKPLGMLWFFFALFIGRLIFDYIHLKIKDDAIVFVLTCITGILGIILGQVQWLPFSMDIAFAIQPFLFWGHVIKKKSIIVTKKPVKKVLLWAVVWIALYVIITPDYQVRTYLELACRRYSLFPISYICAIAGTMFIGEVSVLCSKLRKLFSPIIFLGKNSLYMFCIHAMDSWIRGWWYVDGNQFVSAIRRCISDLIIFIIIMLIVSIIRKIKSKNM